MDLYSSIFQRKSCRKYDMQPLAQETLDAVEHAIQSFVPLVPDHTLEWRFTQQVKGLYHVVAPHYLIIHGKGNEAEKAHVGFLFEQLVLWFDAMELGCVWLGASKDALATSTEGDIIAIGFGKTVGSVHRTRDQFKRKPIAQITNAPEDVCMQAVHLAPSGMNTQPWYFEQHEQRILVYQQKLKLPIALIYKHSNIDMGIGLCHYALACKEAGKSFDFSATASLPEKPGYLPFGIIESL